MSGERDSDGRYKVDYFGTYTEGHADGRYKVDYFGTYTEGHAAYCMGRMPTLTVILE